jgi:MFS family permease
MRVQGVPLQKATLLTSGIMIVCIIGSPLGGWIADWWMKWKIQSRLYVAAIAAILTSLLYFSAFHFFTGGAVQYVIFMLAAISSIAFASSAIAVTQDVVHPGLRAISYALCVVTQHLLGSSIGPIVTGALSDQYGIATALKIASLMGISSCLFFYLGSLFYRRDLEKVEKIAMKAED